MKSTDEMVRKETSEQLVLREQYQPAKNIIKLPEGVELTPTGIVWPEDRDLTPVEWQTIGAALMYMKHRIGWWELDWLAYGEKKYGDITKKALAIGCNPKTLHNKISVARQVPPSRRREGVEISKHAEVAALEPEDQVKWLAAAAEHKLSRQALRESIKRGQIIRGATGKGRNFGVSDILDTRDADGNVILGRAAVALVGLLKRAPLMPLQHCDDTVALRTWILRLEPYVNLQSVCRERLQSIGEPVEAPTNETQIPAVEAIETSVPSPSVDSETPVASGEPAVNRTRKVMVLVPRVDFADDGKLRNSYSADRIDQGKIREPYMFEQANYVAVIICQDHIVAYELVAADQYSGQTHTYAETWHNHSQDSYEGMRVMWRGKPCVLSNRTEFRPQDLPVEQPAATGAEPEKLHEAKTPARDACIATDAPPRPAPSVAREAVQFAENPSAKLPDVEVIAVTGAPTVEVAATVGGNSSAAVPTAPEFRNAETAKPQSENQIDQRIKSYLAHTPASDGIWKQYLKQASVETVEAALAELPSGAPKNARTALESRLRRLIREAAKSPANTADAKPDERARSL